MANIWQQIKKPIMILAPMEGVTDTVFRQIIASVGKPDLYFTEFVNCDGLMSEGKERLIHMLKFSENEHPIIAQIWGIHPETYTPVAEMVKEMGFDGIDINMGCPVRDVTNQGACSALIKNPELAKEIIKATKKGAGGLPVSVKTRIGFNDIQTEEWIGFLLKQDLAAINIHGRTTKEQSAVPAHWDEIAKAVSLKSQISPNTLIIGNGDIIDLADARQKIKETGADGIMIGRGIFHNPWLFNKQDANREKSIEEKLELLIKHTNLFTETWGGQKKFDILKKFFKIYCNGFDGAAELRQELMTTHSLEEVTQLLSTQSHKSIDIPIISDFI